VRLALEENHTDLRYNRNCHAFGVMRLLKNYDELFKRRQKIMRIFEQCG